MCIRVHYAPRTELHDPWDAERRVITLPVSLTGEFALRALRAVLSELGVTQPEFGARCCCGEAMSLEPRIPEQRRSGQVVTHGA